jgi:hypothetical protein
MHQCGGGNVLLLKGGQQVGQEMFDTASEGWVKLADVEDAHQFIPALPQFLPAGTGSEQ